MPTRNTSSITLRQACTEIFLTVFHTGFYSRLRNIKFTFIFYNFRGLIQKQISEKMVQIEFFQSKFYNSLKSVSPDITSARNAVDIRKQKVIDMKQTVESPADWVLQPVDRARLDGYGLRRQHRTPVSVYR